MKFAAILMLGAALAGCNVQAKHHNDNDRNDDNVTISSEADGNVSFDLPFMKGQVKLPEGAMAHGDVDIDGVKLYPGTKLTSFHVEAREGENSVVNMEFKAPATPDKVRAYLIEEFGKKGVKAAASGDAITGTSKDGSPFEIHVQPDGAGSQGTIRLEDKDDDKD